MAEEQRRMSLGSGGGSWGTTSGDGHGVAGVVFDILEEEKVLAQFCLADEVR